METFSPNLAANSRKKIDGLPIGDEFRAAGKTTRQAIPKVQPDKGRPFNSPSSLNTFVGIFILTAISFNFIGNFF